MPGLTFGAGDRERQVPALESLRRPSRHGLELKCVCLSHLAQDCYSLSFCLLICRMGIQIPVPRQVLLLGVVPGIRTDACTTLTRYLEPNGACSVTLRTHNDKRMKGSFCGSSCQTRGSLPSLGVASFPVWSGLFSQSCLISAASCGFSVLKRISYF